MLNDLRDTRQNATTLLDINEKFDCPTDHRTAKDCLRAAAGKVKKHADLAVPLNMRTFSPKHTQLQAAVVEDPAIQKYTIVTHCFIRSKGDKRRMDRIAFIFNWMLPMSNPENEIPSRSHVCNS